jgi:hypothetical protein
VNRTPEQEAAFERKQYEERSKRSTGVKVDPGKTKKAKPKSLYEAISGALGGGKK